MGKLINITPETFALTCLKQNSTHLNDPSLREIAEIVHDLDLKDAKFGREDATGIDRLISGIALAHSEDEVRLSRSSALFDGLYEYFKRRKK